MNFLKPKFWNKKNNLISLLLYPISFFIQILFVIKKKITYGNTFKIPIICIGNIYVGGTGKTPLCMMLSKEFSQKGINSAIIKKYYSKHVDEHKLITNSGNNLFLSNSRAKAIRNAENRNFELAILDDGFQDSSVNKNLNIICFNEKQMIGNGMTLPSGPLRESMSAIKNAQIIVINGTKNKDFEKKILDISSTIKIFYSSYKPLNGAHFKDKKLFAFAGIGNPDNFFKLLRDEGLNLQKSLAFSDHYQFTKSEIQKIFEESIKNNFDLITTEKDFFRIKEFGFQNIKYLKIELQIKEKDQFIKEILKHL